MLNLTRLTKTQVTVIGAGGGIGKPLSLLLKYSNLIKKLNTYGRQINLQGTAMDISHCPTSTKISSYIGPKQLPNSLKNSNLVIILAGVPRRPGMTRDDLFNVNAKIITQLAETCGQVCPNAWVCIVSNPINSTVPIYSRVYKHLNIQNKNIFGVTSLDLVRAKTFLGHQLNKNPKQFNVPVIGGHAGTTIIPLFSQTEPKVDLSVDLIESLTDHVQNAGTEILMAKDGAGSATLSMAYATATFAENCLKAQMGESVEEYAYVESCVNDCEFFSSKLSLNQNGINHNQGLGNLSPYEQKLVEGAIPQINNNVKKAVQFVDQYFDLKNRKNCVVKSETVLPCFV